MRNGEERQERMRNRKYRWVKASLVVALLALAAGCARSTSEVPATDNTAKGTPAPAVSFQNLDGQTVNLSRYRGKVVLVNFWATWCEPCRSEIPELIEYQKKYADKGFTVLGVAMDQEGKSVVAPFVEKQQFDVNGQKMTMNYPIVLGNEKIATQFGGIIGMPTTFVISKDGNVVKRVIGVIDPQGMDQFIQQQL
jgi:cytochrome c biogenesis protein CcmG/thiol:disulfide interchange protein DsbE